MAIASPYETYRVTQAQTATRGELLLMLYDGAIRFACQARNAIGLDDTVAAHNSILRVENILRELSATLDHESSPEIASGLERLYDYMTHRLIQANIKKDSEPLNEVIGMLKELRDTWRQAVRGSGDGRDDVVKSTPFSAVNA